MMAHFVPKFRAISKYLMRHHKLVIMPNQISMCAKNANKLCAIFFISVPSELKVYYGKYWCQMTAKMNSFVQKCILQDLLVIN